MTAEEKAGKIIFDIKLEKGSDFPKTGHYEDEKVCATGQFL